ncbi:polysaccharide deacetylase family protein [Cerasicoccus arenae]|uniref:Oligosaccharide deacetylase n=1 Tax=Cerasicoccus arenae TaxID=424488 RepID=A0A8J3GCG6_9BACT|nr:polysaccharide deacetylase family protein [Cerasicoccus arenae]MBK1859428.1 polysaccharide deacetylase family protein [Cerasicoccus arenae]GHB94059.1 oligosaccharide deacetylase [Cerasicoccus arenae]
MKLPSIALFAVALIAASAPTLAQKISRVTTDQPLVALTFDDGPNGENMEQILAVLAGENATATFFLIGKNVKTQPELARKALAQGNELANHTMTHPHLPKLKTREEIEKQIVDTQKVIFEMTGVEPVLFRPPYLDSDDRLVEVLAENNLPSVYCTRGVGDWEEGITVDKITSRALDGVQGGDIILMHSWSPQTLAALPAILGALKEQGLSCVTVSELMASAEPK